MESIDRTLSATQHLLQALEEDQTLLDDSFFMQKLAYLRKKHKETSDFLARIQDTSTTFCTTTNPTYGCKRQASCPCTCKCIPIEKTVQKPIARDARDILRLTTRGRSKRNKECTSYRSDQVSFGTDDKAFRDTPDEKQESCEVIKRTRNTGKDVAEKPTRSISSVELRESHKTSQPSVSSAKQETMIPAQSQDSISRTTVPKPFKFCSRKPIVNTFSTKFVKEMINKKKQEDEQKEQQTAKSKPFVAHAVPKSTYVSTNPRIKDQAYIEAIRKRLAINLRKQFEQGVMSRKSKSMGDIEAIARPVPLSTYVPPSALPEYRRARSASQRAVKLLSSAKSPPNVREHTIRTHVSTKIRHSNCASEGETKRLSRQKVPNFQKLHAEIDEMLKNAPHKPVTIPKPFNLTSYKTQRHRKCQSSSPPQQRPKDVRRISKGNVFVRPTFSSKIRSQAIKQHQEKLHMDRHQSQRFWEEKKDNVNVNRLKLFSSIGSIANVNEEIERKTAEKRKHTMETTRDYERYLLEMQQRIIERPLILERQSIIAKKQMFTRKYDERMASVGKGLRKDTTIPTERQDSDVSAGTYSIKSRVNDDAAQEYDSAEFEDEDNLSDEKQPNNPLSSTSYTSSASSHSKSSNND